jgi:hypothetical protein
LEGAAVGFVEMKASAEIIDGGRIGPNLQKTKDVIGA